jgi:dethiobiotin synthetase
MGVLKKALSMERLKLRYLMRRGLFITGTGTSVGKTVVTAGIVRSLREKGIDAVPVKPVQTGGVSLKDGMVAPDLDFCLSVAGIETSRHNIALMSPYIYTPACSPHLAGRINGQYPNISHIGSCIENLVSSCDMVVVEGAGGVMVPLNEQSTMLDLMKFLDFPVVLVAKTKLGTINHSLLSIQALRAAGLKVLGVVFNEVEPGLPEDEYIKKDNIETIARLGEVYVLGHVTHLAGLGPNSKDLWRQFEIDMIGMQKMFNLK